MKEMLWRKPMFLGLLLITMVSGAYAQNRFEIEPFVGARFGGRDHHRYAGRGLSAGSIAEKVLNWGFTTGVSIIPHLFGEFMWNRQTTTLQRARHFTWPDGSAPLRGRISIFTISTCSTNSGRPGRSVPLWREALAIRTLILMECSRSRIASPITSEAA